MLTYVVGDLFRSPAKVLVNTVNTVSVMGKGIAYDFKRIYPEMFEEYQFYCENGMFDIGNLWLYKTSHKWVLNFPTKRNWRNKSKIEYIEAGLRKFADTYDSKGIVSISFPMLGCGNGGLDWEAQVQPLMEEILNSLPIEIYVHLYRPSARFIPEHRNIREMKRWLRGEPRYLPFAEFWEDVKQMASNSKNFETFDGSTCFTVSVGLFGEKLHFDIEGESLVVYKDTFEQLWASLRYEGYLLMRDLTQDAPDIDHQILASFLQHLPYVSPVLLSESSNVSDQDVGLLRETLIGEKQAKSQLVKSA